MRVSRRKPLNRTVSARLEENHDLWSQRKKNKGKVGEAEGGTENGGQLIQAFWELHIGNACVFQTCSIHVSILPITCTLSLDDCQ